MTMSYAQCAFCPRVAVHGGSWAVTAQAIDGSWREEILPLCPRCDRSLREAGDAGGVLKATGEAGSEVIQWDASRRRDLVKLGRLISAR
jgi:hypothetical protein